jgi:endonuclease YncB( thermonuclease family)
VRGLLLNAELVRAGLARAVISAPNVLHRDLFLRLESEARTARREIWAAGSAIPDASQDHPEMALAHISP